MSFDFADDSDNKAENKKDSYASKCAARLANALKSKGIKCSPSRLWVKQFEELQNVCYDNEIEDVLTWYIANIKHPKLPKIIDAKGFRFNYRKLEELSKTDYSHIVLSDDAKKLAKELGRLSWPAGVDKELPATIQRCLDNYHDLVRRLKLLLKSLEDNSKNRAVRGFIKYILATKLEFSGVSPQIDFVRQWLIGLHEGLWPEWRGSLLKHADIDVYSKQFDRLGCSWSSSWCENSSRWIELVKNLEKVK